MTQNELNAKLMETMQGMIEQLESHLNRIETLEKAMISLEEVIQNHDEGLHIALDAVKSMLD